MTDNRLDASSPADARGAGPASVEGNPLAFEAAMHELESLVQAMEAGDLSLEQSLAAYQRGASLVSACRRTLSDARQQVRILEAEMLKVFEVADDDAPEADA